MDYYQYQITCSSEQAEILIAFLGEEPFDTFQEREYGLDAFISKEAHTDAVFDAVSELSGRFGFQFEKKVIAYKNWNELWESNFQPIIVGDFCGIRADFHEPLPQLAHEIIINPKMAFGTGHHATTYMVIENMQNLTFSGQKVLDYGCGTGILAILAAQLGAKSIEAVDIEWPSYENTLENAKINDISSINCTHGTLEDIKEEGFDIILANINRNVILATLSTLNSKLVKNGKLIVSGFIEKDTEILLQAAQEHGFLPLTTKNKDNWISIIFEKQ